MNGNDRELMERYIYQVVKCLPKEQRSEVALASIQSITTT